MQDFIPILSEVSSYSLHKLRGDVVSGITIAIILIPQGLAYGQLAGLPNIWGILFKKKTMFLAPSTTIPKQEQKQIQDSGVDSYL